MTACRICVLLLAALCSTSGGLRDDGDITEAVDHLSQDAVDGPTDADSPPEPSDQAAAEPPEEAEAKEVDSPPKVDSLPESADLAAAEPQEAGPYERAAAAEPQEAGPYERAAEVKEVDSPPKPLGQEAAAQEEPGPAEAEERGGPPRDATGAREASPTEAEEAAAAASPGDEAGPVDLSQEAAKITLIKQFKLNAAKNRYAKKVFVFCRTKDEWMAFKTEAEMKNGGKMEYEPGKFKEVKDPFWVCYNPASQEKFKVEKKDANALRPKQFESTDKLPPDNIRVGWLKTPSYDKFFRARKYLQIGGEIYATSLTKKMEQALTGANNNKDWGGLLAPPPSWTARDPLKLVVGSWVGCPYPDCEEVIPMSDKTFSSMYQKVK